MKSGSVEAWREETRGDLRCDIDEGVLGRVTSGSSDCRDILVLRLAGLATSAWPTVGDSTGWAAAAWASSSLSRMSTLSPPSLASSSDDTSAQESLSWRLPAMMESDAVNRPLLCRYDSSFRSTSENWPVIGDRNFDIGGQINWLLAFGLVCRVYARQEVVANSAEVDNV